MKQQPVRVRQYNPNYPARDVILWDIQPIRHEQRLKITFLSTQAECPQGVRLETDKGIVVDGEARPAVRLWEQEAREFIVTCLTENGLLSIYNLWDPNRNGFGTSQSGASGMLLEEQDNLMTYRCNSEGFDSDFDNLVFSIEKL